MLQAEHGLLSAVALRLCKTSLGGLEAPTIIISITSTISAIVIITISIITITIRTRTIIIITI